MSIKLAKLTDRIARLPSIGYRSSRRIVLHLLRNKENALGPLIQDLIAASESIIPCSICGALAESAFCEICSDHKRDFSTICVVATIGDMWAIEKSSCYKGVYHILDGTLSAIDGITPNHLRINQLIERISIPKNNIEISEVILCFSSTMDGQATHHYLVEEIQSAFDQQMISGCRISAPARGIPLGGELEYLDNATIFTAFQDRGEV